MEVLVSIPLDGGQAGVVRDGGGSLWLTDDVSRPMSGIRDFEPTVQGLVCDRTLMGGALPPGAVAAEVRDAAAGRHAAEAGGGAWVVVLDQATTGAASPVRFADPTGATVRAPLPESWPRTPVSDAHEPCPACGATEWEEVRPVGDSRGMTGTPGGGWEPTPFVACVTCGHEEAGASYAWIAEADDDDDAPPARDMTATLRRRAEAALASAEFPIYGPVRTPVTLVGFSHGSGRAGGTHMVEVVTEDGSLSVQTDAEASDSHGEVALARETLETMLHDANGRWPERSEPGLTIWLRTRQRAARRQAAEAAAGSAHIRIDGTPERFELVRAGDRWAAVRRHGALTITVRARGVEPAGVALEPAAVSAGP